LNKHRQSYAMSKHLLIALGIFLVGGLALSALILLFVAPGASDSLPGTSTNLEAETLSVAKGLYCPVCPGVPLDVCDTQACVQWRELIRQKLSEGQTALQIEAYFVEQYGERVLGTPRAQGLNILIYAIPAFVVSAGAAALYLFVQRRTVPVSSEETAAPSADSEISSLYRSRIERELREND
jgi:cytochrome c-type biogenesis protein CcmH